MWNYRRLIMNKQLILMIAFVFALTCIMAEPSFLFKQAQTAEMVVPCIDENSNPCENTVVCNFTSLYPNGSSMISNEQMSYIAAGQYNITLSKVQTEIVGEYLDSVQCSGINSGFSSFTHKVTPSGETGVLGLTIILYCIVFVILGLGYVLKQPYIAILGTLGLMFLGLYSYNNGLDEFNNTITQTISMVVVALGAILSIVIGLEIINENYND